MDKHLVFQSYGVNEETLSTLIEQAKDYAAYKGIAMHISSLPKDARVHLPFCVIPSKFPRRWYEYVFELQPHINFILHKISYSKDILKNCLSSTVEADDFTRNIFNIFENVCDAQNEQLSLGLLRSDYLLHCDIEGAATSIKQVENNTMAAGFGGIGPGMRELYAFISEKLGWNDYACKLPANETCLAMAKGMIAAWNLYKNSSAVIMFLVEESTFNICDQRALEFKIWELNHIEVMRCTFKQLRSTLSVKNNRLYVNGKEVAVVYYRVGYSPKHYEKQDWETRLLIEQSLAIKCPSAGLHLAGTKKVQLYLSQEGILEKFVSSDIAQKLRGVFANQYLLGTDSDDSVLTKVFNNPEKFVLKAEREGGGNNVYGKNIEIFLKSMEANEKKSYILMDRINPPGVLNCIVRANGTPEYCEVTNELGIYGVILGNKDTIYENLSAGHLMRSKSTDLDEGGVAAGFGSLDFPYLT